MYEIKSYLESKGARFKGTQCACVLCDDRNPSAGLYENNGKWRYKCFKCSWHGDLRDLRKEFGDMEPEIHNVDRLIKQKFKRYTKYLYCNGKKPELCVVRTPEKKFAQLHYNRGWAWGGLKTNPIYNRNRIPDADYVIVVEGEKCVHSLHEVGIVAVTSPGGSSSAHKADWSPLYGKTVYIIPDNDAPGKKYAESVREALRARCDVSIIHIPEQWNDVADIPKEDRAILVCDAISKAGDSEIGDYMEDFELAVDGKLSTVQWPWPLLTDNMKSLRPNACTVICGGAGAGKSFFVFQCLEYWLENNIPFSALEMEEGKTYWLDRALAQRSETPGFQHTDWKHRNPSTAREIFNKNKDWLKELSRNLWVGSGEKDTEWVVNWMEQRAQEGSRILLVDPVTARMQDRIAAEDNQLLSNAKRIAETYSLSVVFVTHPSGQGTKSADGSVLPSLYNLAGGAAFERFAAGVFWIQTKEQEMDVTRMVGSEKMQVDKVIHILKSRDSPAHKQIAYEWCNLKFTELGEIRK